MWNCENVADSDTSQMEFERKTNMKKTSRLALPSLLSLLSLASFAAVPQVLTYRGVLDWTGREEKSTSMEMTFRLYDSEVPGKALWARTMRVPVDTNGVFYAELTDAIGSDPDSIGFTLADAMGAIKGTPEIGLTPAEADELSPRQKLSTAPRAARAARAKAADVVYAPTGAYAEGVNIDYAVVDELTVAKDASLVALPPKCSLAKLPEGRVRTIGGDETKVTLRDVKSVRPNWPSCLTQDSFKYTTGSAPCDMIVTYENNDGVFNVIVPAGGVVENANSEVSTVGGTAFGNP